MESGSTCVITCVSWRVENWCDAFGDRRHRWGTGQRATGTRIPLAVGKFPIRHADGLCRGLHFDRVGVDVVWHCDTVGKKIFEMAGAFRRLTLNVRRSMSRRDNVEEDCFDHAWAGTRSFGVHWL